MLRSSPDGVPPRPGPALSRWIEERRPDGPRPDGRAPARAFVEEELSRERRLEPVATVFLVNRECPWRCLFCDLWKGTTAEPLPAGRAARQLREALAPLPPARHLKLYNAGSFFDAKAVPPEDHPEIAGIANRYRTLVVESHPALVGDGVLRFRERLETEFEIAMGLETANPDVLGRLNKAMTVEDFRRATRYLRDRGVFVRAFVLLGLPFLPPAEDAEWAIRSVELALEEGADPVVVIPVRPGNGAMEELAAAGQWRMPSLTALEEVAGRGLALGRGRVFADLWDASRWSHEEGWEARISRLRRMNVEQRIP